MTAGRANPQGMMIAVVGPSGAGKDSLINIARTRLANDPTFSFVRRVITRPAENSGGEAHQSVTREAFDRMVEDDRFAVWWDAHGLGYGIPIETLDAISQGRTLIANGSRGAMDRFRTAFPQLGIIHVTASPETIRTRLLARGREKPADILERLQRAETLDEPEDDAIVISNDGDLDTAAGAFVDAIRRLAGARLAESA